MLKRAVPLLNATRHQLTAIKAETILKRGVSVVLLGVLPIEPLEQLEQSRTNFNVGLKQLAAVKSDVNYLDLSEQFMNKQMRKQELFVDCVHLNEKGYIISKPSFIMN